MSSTSWIVLALPLALALALGGAAAAASETPAESVLIEADEAFNRETGERGLDGWLAWFAADAAVFPDRGPLVRGIEGITAFYEGLGSFPPPGFRWQPDRGGMSASGDLGWTAGSWEIVGSEGNHGRYLSIWGLQQDGSWKVVADCGGHASFRQDHALVGEIVPEPETEPETPGDDLVTFSSATGDLVVRGGRWDGETDSGEAVRGKALVVFERQADGSWKIATETGFLEPSEAGPEE